MDMYDFLYSEEIISRNRDAEMLREGEARGRREERESILNQISEQGLLTPELMKVLR